MLLLRYGQRNSIKSSKKLLFFFHQSHRRKSWKRSKKLFEEDRFKVFEQFWRCFFDFFLNLQVQVMSRLLTAVSFLHIRILWKHVGPCPLPIVSLQAKNYKDLSKKTFESRMYEPI